MAKGEYSCSENVVHEGAVAEVREKMHDGAALDYFNTAHDTTLMHPETGEKLRYILTLLAREGEKAMLAFVRAYVIPDRPYPPLVEKTSMEAKKTEKCS